MSLFTMCPHICSNKNQFGYCKTTACINPKFNGSGSSTYYVSNHTEQIYPVYSGTRGEKDK